jgi:hypothetical protein
MGRFAPLCFLALFACDLEYVPIEPTAYGDFDGPSFWSSPMPGEHRRLPDGRIDVSAFPVSGRIPLSAQLRDAVADLRGFGTTTPVYFPLTVPIDAGALPSATDAPSLEAPVFLVDVDPDSPERGRLAPIVGRFLADAGPFGTTNLLALLPVQGRPLRPNTMYAAAVTDALRTEAGLPLRPSTWMRWMAAGNPPPDMGAEAGAAFLGALDALRELGADVDGLVAFTAFRTHAPTAVLDRAIAGARAGGAQVVFEGGFDAPEIFDDYCAYHTTVRVPVYQAGEPPYASEGGAWVFDEAGQLVLQREETANLWLTLPRAPMPTDGFPGAVLIRTGSGADRPLMDRGPHAAPGGPSEVPGAGLGREFARAGFAGISVEGPHGGSRNVSGGDEQFLVFNIQNPPALRDNLRQSALELALLVDALPGIAIDPASCPGLSVPAGEVGLDVRTLALVGHSMGASIAPLVAASEPRYGALILSGAGGSWIENILYKQRPLATRDVAESLLGYSGRGLSLTDVDPMLALLQWGGEEADAQVYAPALVSAPHLGLPRHVLMFQGILDTYIPPPVANTLTLGLAIDVARPIRDAGTPALDAYTSIEGLLPLTGRGTVALPARGNVDGTTAVVVQLEEDGIEDGHEVMWQRADARQLVTCFLRTLGRGMPTVVDPAAPSCD